MAKLKITQVRSAIGRTGQQQKIVAALGLRKLNQTVEHEDNPQIRGMLDKVSHLVKIEDA